MNIGAIVEACRTNEHMRALMEVLATRERWRKTTDLRRLKREILNEQRIAMSVDEVRHMAKTLERAGIGKFKLGGGDEPDRFTWNTNSVQFGKDVLEQLQDAPRPAYMAKHHAQATQVRPLTFPLRGQFLTIEVFSDITRAEANELAEFIRRCGK